MESYFVPQSWKTLLHWTIRYSSFNETYSERKNSIRFITEYLLFSTALFKPRFINNMNFRTTDSLSYLFCLFLKESRSQKSLRAIWTCVNKPFTTEKKNHDFFLNIKESSLGKAFIKTFSSNALTIEVLVLQ